MDNSIEIVEPIEFDKIEYVGHNNLCIFEFTKINIKFLSRNAYFIGNDVL